MLLVETELHLVLTITRRHATGYAIGLHKLRLAKMYNPDDFARVWRPGRPVAATLVSQH
jgi:hypothetical protein